MQHVLCWVGIAGYEFPFKETLITRTLYFLPVKTKTESYMLMQKRQRVLTAGTPLSTTTPLRLPFPSSPLPSRVALELAETRHEEASRAHNAKTDQLLAVKRLHQGSEPPARIQENSPSLHSLTRSCEAAATEQDLPSRAPADYRGGNNVGAGASTNATGGSEMGAGDSKMDAVGECGDVKDDDQSDPVSGRETLISRQSRGERSTSAASVPAAAAANASSDEPCRPRMSTPAAAASSSRAIRVDEMNEVKLEAALLCGIGRAPRTPVFSRATVSSSSCSFSSCPPADEDVKGMDVTARAASTATSVASAADGRRRDPHSISPSSFRDGTPERGITRTVSMSSSSSANGPLPRTPWGLSSPGAANGKGKGTTATTGGDVPEGKSAESACSPPPSSSRKKARPAFPHDADEANSNSNSRPKPNSSPRVNGNGSANNAKSTPTAMDTDDGTDSGHGGGGDTKHGPPPSTSSQSSSSSPSSMASHTVDTAPSSSSTSSSAYLRGTGGAGGGGMHRPSIARRTFHAMTQVPGSPSVSGETDSDHSDSTNGAAPGVDETGPHRQPRGINHGTPAKNAAADFRRFSAAATALGGGSGRDAWGGYFARGSGGPATAGAGGGRYIAPLAKLAAVATAGVHGGGGGAVEGLRCA